MNRLSLAHLAGQLPTTTISSHTLAETHPIDAIEGDSSPGGSIQFLSMQLVDAASRSYSIPTSGGCACYTAWPQDYGPSDSAGPAMSVTSEAYRQLVAAQPAWKAKGYDQLAASCKCNFFRSFTFWKLHNLQLLDTQYTLSLYHRPVQLHCQKVGGIQQKSLASSGRTSGFGGVGGSLLNVERVQLRFPTQCCLSMFIFTRILHMMDLFVLAWLFVRSPSP